MKTFLEPEDIMKLQGAATYLRDQLLIHLLFHLGCRISEVLSLTIEDIDFTRGTVRIQHLKSRVKLVCKTCGSMLGRGHVFCPRCGKKLDSVQKRQQEYHRQRVLPVDSDTLSIMKDYIKRNGPIAKNGKQLIFGINRHRAWQIVRDCAERAGLPKLTNPETGKIHNVSPHRLRDAFAVHAMKFDDSGEGLRLLQEHLGHQSFNTTARYRKVSGKEHQDWYRRLWAKEKKRDGSGR